MAIGNTAENHYVNRIQYVVMMYDESYQYCSIISIYIVVRVKTETQVVSSIKI